MSRGCRALLAVVVGGLSPAAFSPVGQQAQATGTRPYEVGRLPSTKRVPQFAETSPQKTLVVSSASRRAYVVEITSGSNGFLQTHVTAFDLDSLQQIAYVVAPYELTAFGSEANDADHHRVFFAANSPTGSGIAVLDETTVRPGSAPVLTLTTSPHPAYAVPGAVAGLRYEPSTGKVLVALSPQRTVDAGSLALARSRQPYTTFLAQWDARPGRAPTEDWTHLVKECNAGPIGTEVGATATPFLRADGRAVQMVCGTGEWGWQFVAVPLGDDGRPTTATAAVFPAPSGIRRILTDVAAQRSHVFVGAAYGVTFDWRAGRIIGTIAVSQATNAGDMYPGLDQRSGRIYILLKHTETAPLTRTTEHGGLLLVDGRRTPVPQALAYREFEVPHAVGPVRVDEAAPLGLPRILLRGGKTANTNADPYWRVVADPVPLGDDPPDDLRDQTADVDEVQGKTERVYAGEARGYGARFLVVGGVFRGLSVEQQQSPCFKADRQLEVGGVRRAGLSSLAAAARADVVDADSGTQADARDLSRCGFVPWAGAERPTAGDPYLRDHSPGWAADSAECSGNAGDTGAFEANGQATATVDCRLSAERVEARSTYPASSLGLVEIGRADSDIDLFRDPSKGIVSRVESRAESVVIDGVGSIGLVRAVAQTSAKGRTPRPEDARRATWTVELCGVRTADFEQDGCRGPDEAVAALNNAGRGRVVFTRPQADPALMAGTPGGYLVAIQRERGEASVALLEHGDPDLAIPGLEIQVRNSVATQEINRHVVQLAAVRTASVYGISLIPEEELAVPAPLPPVEPDAAVEPVAAADVDVDDGPSDAGTSDVVRELPKSPIQRIVEVGGDIVVAGWRLFRRSLDDIALMAGTWSAFALPSYLWIRRRRITHAP